jgi:hypothetical protein
MAWTTEQEWERKWHGNCVNSFGEETKQFVYAKKMGLPLVRDDKSPFNFDVHGASIMDMGAGPYSMLLKTLNYSAALVIDPCVYPDWVYARYDAAFIKHIIAAGEDIKPEEIGVFDECWIYNVLQHVANPALIIKNSLACAKIIRLYEWIENGISPGHPQNLTEKDLNTWLKGIGKVEAIDESNCRGLAYYGIFKGDYYGKEK